MDQHAVMPPIALDPQDHTRLRAPVHKAFTPRLVERLRDRIQALCEGLLDRVQRGGGSRAPRGPTGNLRPGGGAVIVGRLP